MYLQLCTAINTIIIQVKQQNKPLINCWNLTERCRK